MFALEELFDVDEELEAANACQPLEQVTPFSNLFFLNGQLAIPKLIHQTLHLILGHGMMTP